MSAGVITMEKHEPNPVARSVRTALINRYPSFGADAEFRDGDVEASIAAPFGSQAGCLVVFTKGKDMWLRFAPPQMCYPVDDTDEMLSILEQILSDVAVFAVVMSGEEWRETMLLKAGDRPTLSHDERAQIVSWSGKYDEVIDARSTVP